MYKHGESVQRFCRLHRSLRTKASLSISVTLGTSPCLPDAVPYMRSRESPLPRLPSDTPSPPPKKKKWPSQFSIKCQKFPDEMRPDLRFKTEEECHLEIGLVGYVKDRVTRLANQEASSSFLHAALRRPCAVNRTSKSKYYLTYLSRYDTYLHTDLF